MDPGEAFYQSKENIQPLTNGRITSQFGTALNAQSNADVQQELNKKMEDFELQLLSYDGDDELAVWVEYLSWIEQSFPKGGKEGNLRIVLEKCLTKFQNATWYNEDIRFIKLWIKYIDIFKEQNQAELYSMAHAHGIGTKSTLFYQCWAYEYEKCNNFKRADEIYLLGIQKRAQPEEALLQSHRNFQTAVARMTLYGTLPSPKRPDILERQVMSSLPAHGSKNQVRNVRTGNSVPRSNLTPLTNANIASSQANNGKQSTLKIFTDDKEQSGLILPHQHLHSLPRPQVTNKENNLEAGPWTGSSASRKQQRAQSIPDSKPPKFQVHTDEPADTDSNSRTSYPARLCPNALQSIKPDGYEIHPMFEMDPTQKPMYAKHKVYNGSREFSFEELRALKYFKKEREKKDCLRPQFRDSREDEGDCKSKLEVPEQDWIHNGFRNKDATAVEPPVEKQSFLLSRTVHSKVSESEEDQHVVQGEGPVFVGSLPDNSSVTLENNAILSRCKPAAGKEGMSSLTNVQEKLQDLSITRRDSHIDKEFLSTSRMPNAMSFGSDTLGLPSETQTNLSTANKSNACAKRDRSAFRNEFKKDYQDEGDKDGLLVSPVHVLKLSKIDGQHISFYPEELPGPTVAHIEPENRMPVTYFESMLMKTSRDFVSPTDLVHSNAEYIEEMVVKGRNESCSSNEPSLLHSQSMTVNTKEAMAFMMNEMWGPNAGTKSVQKGTSPSKGSNKQEPQVDVPFEIFTDDKGITLALPTQHAPPPIDTGSEPTKLKNPQSRSRPKIYIGDDQEENNKENVLMQNLKIYEDEENLPGTSPSEGSIKQEPQVDVPFEIFTDDKGVTLALPTQHAPPSIDPGSEPTKLKNPQSRSRTKFYIGDDQEENNKENVLMQNLKIYEDEENLPVGIPAVASPGMTEIELKALEGTDAKENNPPTNDLLEKTEHRPLEGILQPSRNIPHLPPQESVAQDYEEPEYDNVTCTTQAFNFPLMSSTPFHSNTTPHTPCYADRSMSLPDNSNKDNFRFTSAAEEADQMKLVSQAEAVSKGNLSVIMENSKECKSGSSSGSSNGGTTTRRSTFYNNSQWSSTRESVTELRHRLATSDIHKESTGNTSSEKKTMSEYNQKNDQKEGLQTKHFHCFETKEEFIYMDSKQTFGSHNGKSLVGEDCEVVKLQGEFQDSSVIQDQLKELFTADVFSSPAVKASKTCMPVSLKHTKESCPTKEVDYPEKCFKGIEMKQEAYTATLHVATTTNSSEGIRSDIDNLRADMIEEFEHRVEISKLECQDLVPDGQLAESLDPFDTTLINKMLENMRFPHNQNNYFEIKKDLPLLKRGSVVSLGNATLTIESQLGVGAYATVFKVKDSHGIPKAFKVQKPSWVWEMYITNEIHSRLESTQQRQAFMHVEECFAFKNASALKYEYSKYGTLLNAINKMKTDWKSKEVEILAMFWASEMLRIVEQLHSCQIIHGDVKPDNFILRSLPSLDAKEPTLQLIDFGRGIDLTLFAPGTSFNIPVKTESFQCIEMQTGRPWTYQTDLYGVAASVHCILFGEYMKVSYTRGRWFIKTVFPRYFNQPLWESFFVQLLNVESCNKMPDLQSIRQMFEREVRGKSEDQKRLYPFSYFRNIMS